MEQMIGVLVKAEDGQGRQIESYDELVSSSLVKLLQEVVKKAHVSEDTISHHMRWRISLWRGFIDGGDGSSRPSACALRTA